ncbi:hypothetical protein K402DRAFT_400355 [Aulographum hederae CBS 113979]|uniref:Glycine zipper 2TM domain-containing protein n=1 Tax=Aulographum hederae CBS 113979 TaxID=1176131 RepID=A0A6G1HEP0_9PEZI|nr:hypothetical protein K402DRAFT_400355 [Aulographum hederae CBS 113979]
MAALALKAIAYGAENIPDSVFEALPGKYFKKKEEKRRRRAESRRRQRDSEESRRSGRTRSLSRSASEWSDDDKHTRRPRSSHDKHSGRAKSLGRRPRSRDRSRDWSPIPRDESISGAYEYGGPMSGMPSPNPIPFYQQTPPPTSYQQPMSPGAAASAGYRPYNPADYAGHSATENHDYVHQPDNPYAYGQQQQPSHYPPQSPASSVSPLTVPSTPAATDSSRVKSPQANMNNPQYLGPNSPGVSDWRDRASPYDPRFPGNRSFPYTDTPYTPPYSPAAGAYSTNPYAAAAAAAGAAAGSNAATYSPSPHDRRPVSRDLYEEDDRGRRGRDRDASASPARRSDKKDKDSKDKKRSSTRSGRTARSKSRLREKAEKFKQGDVGASAIGALAGAVIGNEFLGHQTGHKTLGTLVGAAVGGIGGKVLDNRNRKRRDYDGNESEGR